MNLSEYTYVAWVSIPGLGIIRVLSLLSVLVLATGGFSRIIFQFLCCLPFVHSQSFKGQTKLALSNTDIKFVLQNNTTCTLGLHGLK